jgi:hypothetical protein
MSPQLQINQGPQDALLYDNTRSYFTNVGYVRTSNFQVEYRDVDSQNTAAFGTTVQYVIPKAADLLGPCDLVVDLKAANAASQFGAGRDGGDVSWAQWVDELGFAMIEKATLSIGSNDIETITGEQMQIKNELMTSDEQRLGFDHTMKTGRRALTRMPGEALQHLVGVYTLDAEAAGPTTSLTGAVTQPAATDHAITVDSDYGFPVWHRIPRTGDLLKNADGTVTYGHLTQDGRTDNANFQNITGAAIPANTKLFLFRTDRVGVNRTENASEFPGLANKPEKKDYTRLIAYEDATGYLGSKARQLVVPLNFFFTKHVSQYFPLAAIAGCNDVRIAIKFRNLNELVQLRKSGTALAPINNLFDSGQLPMDKARLRCHYVHVTGPEATTLMNKEHVRLMKLWQSQSVLPTLGSNNFDVTLSMLHPIMSLVIVIRRRDDMNSDTDGLADCQQKGFFFYHGDGMQPNYDTARLKDGVVNGVTDTVRVKNISLSLNGQERHPGLEKGIPADYLKHRLTPMLHSNSNALEHQLRAHSAEGGQVPFEMKGSKSIFVYPFSLNPEGSNPSGAVNFSKVSHAKLRIELDTDTGVTASADQYVVDVYGLHYNWLQIKDGRALLSFA